MKMFHMTVAATLLATNMAFAHETAEIQSRYSHPNTKGAEKVHELAGKIDNLPSKIKWKPASVVTRLVTLPTGETVRVASNLGENFLYQLPMALIEQSVASGNCIAEDWKNPFNDGACLVEMGGKVVAIGLYSAADGVDTILVGATRISVGTLETIREALESAGRATGEWNNPVGGAFMLSAKILHGGEMILTLVMQGAQALVYTTVDGVESIVVIPFKSLAAFLRGDLDEGAYQIFTFIPTAGAAVWNLIFFWNKDAQWTKAEREAWFKKHIRQGMSENKRNLNRKMRMESGRDR